MVSKYHYTYRITCRDLFYIGCHSTKNMLDGYFGSGVILKSAIKAFGKENFDMTVISMWPTRDEMLQHEKELLTKSFLEDQNCLNLVPGGKLTRKAAKRFAAKYIGKWS